MVHDELRAVASAAGALAAGVAWDDLERGEADALDGDRWFHAASTYKAPLMLPIFEAVEAGRLTLDAPVHVRNRFISVADGSPYRVSAATDANDAVHAAIGKTMPVGELVHHMIVTSSNLATNVLFDLVGAEAARGAPARAGLAGLEILRGVEDDKAFEAGLSNRVTARGLVGFYRALHDGRAVSPRACAKMLEVLFQQAFRSGIPAGLPEAVRERARVAHKTGEISTVTHDAGLVYLPGRAPYALAVLTEWPRGVSPSLRRQAVADLAAVVHRHLGGCSE